MVQNQGVGALLHHVRGNVFRKGLCLNMQVAEHLVTAAASNKFDDSRVNYGT